MFSRLSTSSANAMAALALAVSLGGTAYASGLITGGDIKNGSITTKDLKKNAVKTKKVKNGSLLSEDFKAGQIPAGLAGPQGPQGLPGPKGDKGDPGTNGTDGTNGADGANGADGTNGANGADGARGPRGQRGPSFGDAKYADTVSVASCGTDATTMSYPVTLSGASRIYASAGATYRRTDPGPDGPSLRVQLLDSGSNVVATTARIVETVGVGENELLAVAGVLRSGGTGTTGTNVPAGTYTLRLVLDNFGACSGTGTYSDVSVSHIVLGTS